MDKNLQYLESLKNEYVDLNFKVNNCIRELEDFEIKRFENGKCIYKSKSYVLDELVERIDSSEKEVKGRNFIKRLLNPEVESVIELKRFMNRQEDNLGQIKRCVKCACFSCSKDCTFDPCTECNFRSRIETCNRESFNVRVFDNYIETLVKPGNPAEMKFRVLAIIEIEDNRRFAFMENLINRSNKLILECVPSKSKKGYDFAEVTDNELFQKLVSLYEINV